MTEKQKLEQRTEQLLKERKERAKEYVKGRLSESTGPENTKKDPKRAKKQIKLPSTDLLYLNHEYEDREDFDRIEQNPMSIRTESDYNQTESIRKRQISFPVSYEHVQSTLNSKHSASDLISRQNKSQTSSDMAHDTSSHNTASNMSILSKDDLVRTNKKHRRQEIESKFKNPLERDFMEMMETDIEKLSECFAIESGQDLDIPPDRAFQSHTNSSTYLLDQQVKNMQHTFSKNYQNHYTSFLEERLNDDMDRLGNGLIERRDRSPRRRQMYGGMSKSPDREKSPKNDRFAKAKAYGRDIDAGHGKGMYAGEPIVEDLNIKGNTSKNQGSGPIMSKNRGIQNSSHKQMPSKKPVNPQLGERHHSQIMTNNQPHQKENLYHAKATSIPVLESESIGNKTKNSGFLRNNKYTEGQNNAIYEESSDNPFDKFEKNVQANKVLYFKLGKS